MPLSHRRLQPPLATVILGRGLKPLGHPALTLNAVWKIAMVQTDRASALREGDGEAVAAAMST
jgi:hypothetical protein